MYPLIVYYKYIRRTPSVYTCIFVIITNLYHDTQVNCDVFTCKKCTHLLQGAKLHPHNLCRFVLFTCKKCAKLVGLSGGVHVICGLITPDHSLMLSWSLPIYQVRLDWLPLPCIYYCLDSAQPLSCLGSSMVGHLPIASSPT